MKKAQGISMNVIIIAAIALLVLVVLSVIYIGRMGTWGKTTNDCESNGGFCKGLSYECGQKDTGTDVHKYPLAYPLWSCQYDTEDAKHCCIKIKP